MHKHGLSLWRKLRLGAVAAGLALAWTATATSADAFIIGFGFPYPGFYAAPWPAYPPPGYYPYYPPYYPPAPAYYPPSAEAAPAPAGGAEASGMAAITYTDRPAYRNAVGQTCRQYRAPNGAFGSACEDAGGQWRVAD